MKSEVGVVSRAKKLKVVDLFCGAGGLGYGFQEAGFDLVWAADSFGAAVSTYKENIGDHIELTKLGWETNLPASDLIIGGPPCQGFSSAGLRKPGDARNTLVSVFSHLVARHRPKAFVFENVEGFLTGEGGKWVTDLLGPLVDAGYCIHLRKINAANYGVPQHRKRVLAIGGLGWDPGFPIPTHRASGAPGAGLVGGPLPECPGVGTALSRMPPASSGADSAILSDHFFRPPNDTDLTRFEALGPGQTMRDLPEALWHPTFKKRAFRRVMDGTPVERRGGAPSGVRRLDPKAPSKAITSGATSEFIHPTEDRNLTLRECARLQTFPDSFKFIGKQAERALLIGNAVPPMLGRAIANQLFSSFSRYPNPIAPPGLSSFVPTNSTGMSPALSKTVLAVAQKYGFKGSLGAQVNLFDGLDLSTEGRR
jgi:DNA (cytosine-5)-methyltransferase 1